VISSTKLAIAQNQAALGLHQLATIRSRRELSLHAFRGGRSQAIPGKRLAAKFFNCEKSRDEREVSYA
jgi:hypothetical protein